MPKSSPIFLDANSCQFLSRLCWSWILNPKGSSDTVNKVDMFEEHVFVQQHFNQQSNCETRYKIKCIFISNLKLIFGSIIVLMHFQRRLQNKKNHAKYRSISKCSKLLWKAKKILLSLLLQNLFSLWQRKVQRNVKILDFLCLQICIQHSLQSCHERFWRARPADTRDWGNRIAH